MRKLLVAILFVAFLQGCAAGPGPQGTDNVAAPAVVPGALPEASLGMRRDDIVGLLDREVTAGYEKDQASGEFRPIKARALYSTEMIEVNGITYQVDSYIVAGMKTASPGGNDLMPLIYQKGILVGKGKAELEALRARSK